MIFSAGVGGSTAARPTEEKIPNDPEGGSGGSPFQAPQAWAAWNQGGSSFLGVKGADAGSGGAPGMPSGASGTSQGSAAWTPGITSTVRGPGGSLVDPASLGPRSQAAIQNNNQFVNAYSNQQSSSNTALMDSLKKIADMASFTNPYSGQNYQGSVS